MSYSEFDSPMYKAEPGMQQPPPPQPIMQQPMAGATHTTNTTTVVLQQPTIIQGQGPRVWSTELCGCCEDFASCCLVSFFPLCYEMHLYNRSNENCCTPCCVHNSAMALRIKLRTQQNIHGSVIGDCCTSVCCYQCALCQMSREMDFIERTGQDGGVPRTAMIQ